MSRSGLAAYTFVVRRRVIVAKASLYLAIKRDCMLTHTHSMWYPALNVWERVLDVLAPVDSFLCRSTLERPWHAPSFHRLCAAQRHVFQSACAIVSVSFRYVHTNDQLADILTASSFTTSQWSDMMRLFHMTATPNNFTSVRSRSHCENLSK